ncbi:hypothetical protein T265_10561 [Opisthorchis viverrini]|uniref:AD domain-containing protein n=1 Tax=Opisthorchis viverrini TaxID=6198 RepID=A0A075A0S0_OPIVI|nr:hypothetical protein T265_10561 [Opisthorchis viverrini]KER21009.1 hypothetical protein T265_10561 [Opisthorchis viverrini]
MRILALASILPRTENIKSSAAPFFHLCFSHEGQPLTDKNKTDPGNLGKRPDPVYQSVKAGLYVMTVHNLPKAGSTISALVDDVRIEGEVLCIDEPKKLVVILQHSLETSSSTGRRDTCDIIFARTEFLKEVKMLKEGPLPSFPELSINKIAERIRKNERTQQEKQKFYRPDVPPEVRNLAEHIEKTLFDVVWSDPNIVVMEHSIISPPYKEDNSVVATAPVSAEGYTVDVTSLFASHLGSHLFSNVHELAHCIKQFERTSGSYYSRQRLRSHLRLKSEPDSSIAL